MTMKPILMQFAFRVVKIPRPAVRCSPRNNMAFFILNSPEARGLFLVLSTFLSKSLSHMSLMMQPADLMTSDPEAKVSSSGRSGIDPCEPEDNRSVCTETHRV
jgi:hypothetical protein